MEFTVQAEFESVSVGTYQAKLKAIDELPPTTSHPEWGSSLLWKFEIVSECQFKGKEVVAFTPSIAKENNNLGKLLRQMMGRKLMPQEKVNVSPLMEQTFNVVVDLNGQGTKTRVVSAHPIQGGAVAAPATPPAPKMAALAAAIAPPAPTAPKPPKPATDPSVKKPVTCQRDYGTPGLWCFVSVDGDPSFEATVGSIRQKVVSGAIDSSKLQAYIPDTGEWIPWALVDVPF
jgi:hypothetical protein